MYEIIPVIRWGWGWDKSLIPVGFRYGDGDEFFLQGWVWDSETRARPVPLPSLVARNGTLSFLDAYSGYNQIPMAAGDEIKIAFITEEANLYYKVMPFRLKNVGATYQRLMDRVFKPLLKNSVEVYVDDIVVKSPNPHPA